MQARRVPDRVDVSAGDVQCGRVLLQVGHGSARRLDDHERMVRIERADPFVRADEPRRGHSAECRLVDALPGAERRVPLERVHDLRQQLLVRRARRRRQVRQLPEPRPAAEAVRPGGVEQRPLVLDLTGDELRAPVPRAGAEEADAGSSDLRETVATTRCDARRRRPVREDDREDLLATDEQASGRRVDPDDGHP